MLRIILPKRRVVSCVGRLLWLLILCGLGLPASSQPLLITEFVADNVLGLKDDDGDAEDWIEVHNPGAVPVDLAGWRLTDDAGNLAKWVFPAVTLGAREHLVVFASGKDRRTPGRPLHANFRLSADGEYLALVHPDGTVVSQFAPSYPAQPPDVAYGLEAATVSERWITQGTPARWRIPLDDSLGTSWRIPGFQDAAWDAGPLGYGWDRSATSAPIRVADSEEDWSVTGEAGYRGWFQGYYSRTRDGNGAYSAAEFVPFPASFWDGVQWRSPGGVAPWDRVTRTTARPTGINSGEERWVIRRWISSVAGDVTVTWRLAKRETTGTGVSARLFQQGIQRDSAVIAAGNTTGVTRTVLLSGISVGDAIDLALLPTGIGSATDDVGDDAELGFSITAVGAFPSWIRTDLGSAMFGRNASAWVRVPFILSAEQVADVEALDLSVRFDDGLAVFLNGEPAGQRNAPVDSEGGVIADSRQDWSGNGTQGYRGWYHGFYRRSEDVEGSYDPVTEFETGDPQWTWTGDEWQLGPGDPPWNWISRETWHPNGNGGGANVLWTVRRWVSQAEGAIRVALAGAKQNTGCGNGVTFRILFNGEERWAHTLAFDDARGFAGEVELENVQLGDLIDFVLDPTGTDGDTADGCDGSTFIAQVHQEASRGLTWNSTALRPRMREEAVRETVLPLTRLREHLVPGTNVLAFHVLNAAVDDDDLLLAPELIARRRVAGSSAARYFVTPTPGTANSGGTVSPGPVVVAVEHEPNVPDDAQPLIVRAQVRRTVGAIASVDLLYRVMYGAEVTVPMADDGVHDDGAAGDGWWGARIPAQASSPGQMVRWAVMARDAQGRTLRSPAFADSRRTPQYHGTVVRDPAAEASALPVLHWFLQNTTAADSDAGTRGSLFYDGEFYDNVGANLHGQSTRGFPKKSYDLDFNPGFNFRWQRGQPRVDDLNLLTTWADKSHFRTVLAYETYAQAGAPAHFAFPVRVQLNARFHAVANLVENGDGNFLQRLGLDSQGALYKMYNSAESASGAEKKSRKFEGSQDLAALISGVTTGTAQAREAFLFDHLDVPEVVNYLAARALTADSDCCHKNYYLYRDTRNSGEWMAFPWDVDLSFGRVWTCNSPCFSYFDETIYTNTGLFVGDNNRVFSAVMSTPSTRQMYLRRLRTLADQWTQPPEVSLESDRWRLRTSQWRDRIAPDAALDLAKWGTWGRRETITQAVDRIHREFLPGRRNYLFRTLVNSRVLPAAQAADVLVRFAAIEARPASGNPVHEFLCVTNPNPVAVDLSDWRLDGVVRMRFKAGTVLPARGAAYVSPDRRAFRARTTSPKGGERRLVLGNYDGELNARGGTVTLSDASGRRVAEWTLNVAPSESQEFLRVSEIHFHPRDGNPEFVELMNVGTRSIGLGGVRFTKGISWVFPAADAPSLAPGERGVLVNNAAAFRAVHGAVPRILGVYTGSLDNAGERLRLEDAAGEAILDFMYPVEDMPAADGLGFSLVARDVAASWERWAEADFWRIGSRVGGTPGAADDTTLHPIPVVVSEVLTHTDPPLLDAVELFNWTSRPVSLDGWWLTDDPRTPQKYRFPAGTSLAAGARLVVDETQLNAVGPPDGFTFSSHGDDVWLFQGDAGGRLTGEADGFAFSASANGVSFGRMTNSAGRVLFPPQSVRSLGTANAGPALGPVVIHEIQARPSNGDVPFIELRNLTSGSVPLFDPDAPENTWRLDGVDYDFPPGLILPPGGFALVVGGDPRGFRDRWQIPAHVPVLGPWSGELQRDGERLELLRPDAADVLADGSILVPYLQVDAVTFGVEAPWPALRESALGASLERRSGNHFSDDPATWQLNLDGATPGTLASENRVPRVDVAALSPVEATRFPLTLTLSGTASDDGLPADPGRLEIAWAQTAGPGAVEFEDSLATRTQVQLPGPGSYRLRLTAFDGEFSGASEILVEITRPAGEATLVAPGENWRYWDQGPTGTTWAQVGFDDRAWPAGAAPLGYGDGDERTVIRDTFQGSRLLTAYFRRAFLVENSSGVGAMTLRLVRDDGALVWLNGAEVMRSNLPEGPLTYASLAPGTVSGVDESAFFEQAVDPSLLRNGTNVLAVEVHQQNSGSSDISFDLEVRAIRTEANRAPAIEAGPDQELGATLPASAVLKAAWDDDGLPGAAVLAWRQVDGPVTARWASPTNQSTAQVALAARGTYRFEVTVSDGVLTASDRVSVVVSGDVGESYEGWRAQHFSAAEQQEQGISGDLADPDADGMVNRLEFDSGTNPREAASVLRLRILGFESGVVRVGVPVVAGRSYEVQARDEGGGGWVVVSRLPASATDKEVAVDVSVSAASRVRYVRVITPAP